MTSTMLIVSLLFVAIFGSLNVARASCPTITTSNLKSLVGDWIDNPSSFTCDLEDWDVSEVTSLANVFCGSDILSSCNANRQNFNADLSKWNVAKVTSLFFTFLDAYSFEGLGISEWNVARVTNLHNTFADAKVFNANLSKWDVSKVTASDDTFHDASAFTGTGLSSWNVDSLQSMQNMFDEAISFNQDLSGWRVSSLTTLKRAFSKARSFNGDISTWDTSKVVNLYATFWDTPHFNQDISKWNVGRVSDMRYMLYSAGAFNRDISSWDVSSVASANEFGRAFAYTTSLSDCNKRFIYDMWTVSNVNFASSEYSSWSNLEVCARSLEDMLTNEYGNGGPYDCGYGRLDGGCSCTSFDASRLACTTCGSIPESLGFCEQLEELSLRELSTVGTLTGTIPTTLGYLHRLGKLDLGGGHNLHGTLPTELGRLSSLRHLDVSENVLTGSIPRELGNASRLEHLDLSHNSLNASLPTSLFTGLSNLTSLIVTGNRLSGSIATEVGHLQRLVYFFADRNQLSGPAPSEIGKLKRLETLALHRNRLSGEIQWDTFANLSAVKSLHLAHNLFTGAVPSHSGMPLLEESMLYNNAFSEVRSRTFDGCSSLASLNLANQQVEEVTLRANAFRGVATSGDLVLSGCIVRTIPSNAFFGRVNAVIDLSNVGVQTLESDAFAGTSSVRIDLRGNYITRVSSNAFPDSASVQRTDCVDVAGWSTTRDSDGAVMDCDAFDLTVNRCDEPGVDICRDAELGNVGVAGMTALEACCAFGGGSTYGTGLLLSRASPIFCEPALGGGVTCKCNDPSARFDVSTSQCVVSCADGEVWQNSSNVPLFSGVLTGECRSCSAGRFSPSGNFRTTECERCSPGRFSDRDRATSCDDCPGGKAASSSIAATSCTMCVNGTRSEIRSASTICEGCMAGRYSYGEIGATRCVQCETGRYAPTTNASTCVECLRGHETGSVLGATQCVACEAGRFTSNDGSTRCIDCARGRYAPNANASMCFECMRGHETGSALGATECVACEAGRFAPNDGSTMCTDCVRGYHASGSAASECKICVAGTRSLRERGSEGCVGCSSGRFSANNGSVSCATCPLGTFSPGNSSFCASCPLGKEAVFEADGDATCTDLPAGQFGLGEACRENEYSTGGASACAQCPSGRSSTVGASACQDCEFAYMMSKHCEVPIMGGVTAVVLICAIVLGICVIRRHFRKRLVRTEMERDRSRSMLTSSLKEIEQMQKAWRIEWSAVKLVKRLAAGGFGEVWRGKLNDSIDVAVKRMFDSRDVDFSDDSEIRFLQRARHPRLVMFIGCGREIESGNIFVLLEYMNFGDLSHLLYKRKPGEDPPAWSVRLSLLGDVAEGMDFLHLTHRSIHRDLKTENCLLHIDEESNTIRCKVADFGLSRFARPADETDASESKSSVFRWSSKRKKRKKKKKKIDLDIQGGDVQMFQDLAMKDDACDDGEEHARPRINTAHSASMTSIGSVSTSRGRSPMSTGSSRVSHGSSFGDGGVDMLDDTNPDMVVPASNKTMTAGLGTPVYMAPEICAASSKVESKYDRKIDVYSFAIIMWETLAKEIPWQQFNFSYKILKAVEAGDRPKITDDMTKEAPDEYVALMKWCWAQNPKKRPEFDIILASLRRMETNFKARPVKRVSLQKTTTIDPIPDLGEPAARGGSVVLEMRGK